MEGVSSADLNNVLDYIYNGEVEIYQEHLDRFLNLAERFKIEGLLGTGKQEEVEEIIPTVDPPTRKPEKPEKVEIFTNNTPIQMSNQSISLNTTDLNEIDEKLCENMEKHSDGIYSCKICSKTMKDKTKMRLHVETHMEGLSFPCNVCGKEFRSRNAFKTHISKKRCQLSMS